MQEELDQLGRCFCEIDGYPKWLLEQTFDSFNTNHTNNNTSENSLNDKTIHTLRLPYQGNEGFFLLSMKKHALLNEF